MNCSFATHTIMHCLITGYILRNAFVSQFHYVQIAQNVPVQTQMLCISLGNKSSFYLCGTGA
jgi:hypothetical protein